MDRLLTKDEQNILANMIDETRFETSVQYWEAILEVIIKAQDAKTLKVTRKWLESLPINPLTMATYLIDFDIMMMQK